MTKIVLVKNYRPFDDKDGTEHPESAPGTVLDVSPEEATRAIDNGIALSPDDAAKAPGELDAVALLTDLGYTVTAPKAVLPKATGIFVPKQSEAPLNG